MEQKKTFFLIATLWIVLTAININKAFHIDDTFHLKAAEYIIDHPSSPMSGVVNWGENPSPLYTHNQPPLFFYLIAIFIKIFGKNEIGLHLLVSIFTYLVLYWFHRITELLDLKHKKLMLLVFSFCPALIINQNLMVDIPILAMLLGSLYFILKARKNDTLKNHLLAAILLSLGLLIKYTLLPILLVFILNFLITGKLKRLWIIIIPVLSLVLWSYWNYKEFGEIHLINRPKSSFQSVRIYEFIACLGALSTFLPTFLYGTFPNKTVKYILFTFFISYSTLSIFKFFSLVEFPYYGDLNNTFLATGAIIILTMLILQAKTIFREKINFIYSDKSLILLSTISLMFFIIFFSPFIATRHILLIIPLLIILGNDFFEKADKYINTLSLAATISLGLILSISDWKYADFYRETARTIKINTKQNIWSVGHWGWQWYSEKAGMKIYAKDDIEAINIGDYFVFPKDVHKQEINESIKIQIVNKLSSPPSFFTFFSVHHFASMYKSEYNRPPWRLSDRTIDTIIIAKVVAISK